MGVRYDGPTHTQRENRNDGGGEEICNGHFSMNSRWRRLPRGKASSVLTTK